MNVEINGSHGTLIAHRETGVIVEYRDQCDCGDDYHDIARIDPISIQTHAHYDILNVAYWLDTGVYVPALSMMTGDDDDFFDWRQAAVLPPPERVQ